MIEFIGHANAEADTVALPAFQEGDIAVVCAWDDTGTPPSLPASGWTNKTTSGQTSTAHRVGYRFLVTGDTDTGVWANAASIQVNVYRGVQSVGGAGNKLNAAGGDANIYSPAVTLTQGNGTSWIVTFVGKQADPNTSNVNSRTFSLMTNRSSGHDAANTGAWDTDGGVSSWTEKSTTSNNSGRDCNTSVELVEKELYAVGPAVVGRGAAVVAPLIERSVLILSRALALVTPSIVRSTIVIGRPLSLIAPSLVTRRGVTSPVFAIPGRFLFAENDTSVPIRVRLYNAGSSLNLGSAENVFVTILDEDGTAAADDEVCQVIDGEGGVVQYFPEGLEAGNYFARFSVEWGGGARSRAPTQGFVLIRVRESAVD